MAACIDRRSMYLLTVRCASVLRSNFRGHAYTPHIQQCIATQTIRQSRVSKGLSNCALGPNRTYCRQHQNHRLWQMSADQPNPLRFLNEFSRESVLPLDDFLFEPNSSDMRVAQGLFQQASREDRIRVQKGIVDLTKLPSTEYPEVSFLGRSNVGKSSLIKAIFNTPKIKVSISKTPGHTRVLKFYDVCIKHRSFSLVDMPGYGHNMPEYFVESMEEYLKTRKQLMKVFLLVDGNVGLQPVDETAIAMLEEFARPYVIVMTKIDKGAPSRILNHVLELRQKLNRKTSCCFPQPFLVSSTKMWGIPMLQSFIPYVTGAITWNSIS